MTAIKPTFQGEVQMRRWSDSSTQGVQVTFALADASELEPLKAKTGKRFMAVLVEIGDDEQPVQPTARKDQRGPLCREACDLCRMPDFQVWVNSDSGEEPTEASAASALKFHCTVESRKEFDTDKAAGERFIRLIRVPFMRWQRERRAA